MILSAKVARTVSPEVKIAAVQALLSEGEVGIAEVLRDRRDETLALVQRLLASAGIKGTFSLPEEAADAESEVDVKLIDTVVDAPEAVETGYLATLKPRFDARPELHPGVEWTDVKTSLEADPAKTAILEALDAKEYEMNVFRSKDDDVIQFRTAQRDVTKIAAEHRTIMYDKQAQIDYPQYKVNGNAKDIAASMGCELADQELYEQSRVQHGWVWVETDDATRSTGYALNGLNFGVRGGNANFHEPNGSLCVALRVKKAA